MMTYGIWGIRAAMTGAVMLGFAGSAVAADPTPAEIATARKLIDIKGVGNIYDPILVGIIERAKYTFLQTNPMLSNDLNAVAAQIRKELQPQLEQFKNGVAKNYASHFTEKELNEVYAFYKTPLGAKVIVIEPQVLQESMKQSEDWRNEIADEVISKMRSEMRKRGHEL